jgi:preprotein translocase subunit SecD
MMRFSILIICICISINCFAQKATSAQDSVTGFYIVIHSKKACQKSLPFLDGKKTFCLTNEPIIKKSEFASVTSITQIQDYNFISLTLTSRGFNKYNEISVKMKGTQMALVVEDKVVAIFTNNGEIFKSIQIGKDMSLSDLQWVYQKLKL